MKKNIKLSKVEPVKIKPLFGIKPAVWVSACYLIAFILLLFLIGFLPDLINGSRQVTFTSKAGLSAVYVDSVYSGGTPFTATIKSGKHTADFIIGGEKVDSIEFNVRKPVFFGWLFPRKMSVESDKGLSLSAYNALTKTFLEDVANYSAVLSYDKVYKYPPLFETYALALKSMDDLSSTDYKDILNCATAFITTTEMLHDAESAYNLLNLSFDFTGIQKAVSEQSFKSETEKLIGLSLKSDSSLITPYFICNGTSVNGFTLDNHTVSESMYFYFVKENPNWSLSNKENLINQGLVDEYYLSGVSLSASNSSRPVRNISYYAAVAFCEWLSDLTGKEVFIPQELQWTTAANFNESGFQKTLVPSQSESGPSGILGSVWEFTSTPYIPLISLYDYSLYDILSKYDAQVEVIIKGGSYISKENNISTYSIGTSPLNLCSDYMGFRIAWR